MKGRAIADELQALKLRAIEAAREYADIPSEPTTPDDEDDEPPTWAESFTDMLQRCGFGVSESIVGPSGPMGPQGMSAQ